nr:MAG TPA: hypothetical protein [Bacteriophage sp.]
MYKSINLHPFSKNRKIILLFHTKNVVLWHLALH